MLKRPGVSTRRLLSLIKNLHPSSALCTRSFAVWYWLVRIAFCACWSSSLSSKHSWLLVSKSLANVIFVSTAAPSLVCSKLLMKSTAESFTLGFCASAITSTSYVPSRRKFSMYSVTFLESPDSRRGICDSLKRRLAFSASVLAVKVMVCSSRVPVFCTVIGACIVWLYKILSGSGTSKVIASGSGSLRIGMGIATAPPPPPPPPPVPELLSLASSSSGAVTVYVTKLLFTVAE